MTTEDEQPRVFITQAQAFSLLPSIHTVMGSPPMLIGADHGLDSIVDNIRQADKIEIGGPQCRSTGHGLVVHKDGRLLFIECKDEYIQEFLDNTKEMPLHSRGDTL